MDRGSKQLLGIAVLGGIAYVVFFVPFDGQTPYEHASKFVKDGVAMEGSHNNLFAVFDGVITTHPSTHEILPGITRSFIFDLARGLGLPVAERAIPVEEFREADEVFFTGTTVEIRPTVQVDGHPVGDGKVGPVTRALWETFVEATDRVAGQFAQR